MDKNAIQRFTEWAKIELTKAVKQKAFEYGIFEKSIIDSNSIIGEKVLTSIEQKQRKELVKQINENGYDAVIEEITYTWFNRFIALRFMEVNGYLPTKVRVFSDDENNFNPQILKEALTIELDNIDKTVIIDYLTKNDNETLYKYLLIAQCNSLNKIIPTLFEKIANYTELLFPDNLLKKNSVLEHLVTDIKEEDWEEQVQILGWIYQFYVACDREEYRKVKVIKKEHIPTLSQIFTPDWIVRYMTENSLGRVWLESYPNSPLKENMKYYVDDAEQEEEVQKKLDEIKYKNVNPEDIKVIEPCCGSGHILVYIFDLLYKMYEEKGYKKSDIPTLIFKNNIWGLDIDKRASQLANFSLLMKARSMDNRFFSREKIAKPKIYEIIDSQSIKKTNYMEIMDEAGFTKETIAIAKYLVDTYENAKVIGSLLKVNIKDYSNFVKELREKKKEGPKDLFHTEFYEHTIAKLIKLAKLASTMIRKYDVMVTNPPYLGSSSLEPICKEYATIHYPNSKADMFAMFMEAPYVKKNGFRAIVNPDSWMFLVSFEGLRKKIIMEEHIVNMMHLGMGSFDAVVQTTSFVLRNTPIATNGVYFRLVDSKDKEADFLKNIGGVCS